MTRNNGFTRNDLGKPCRNDIMMSEPESWPRSCPRCDLGPCQNLANKDKHLAFQPSQDYYSIMPHAETELPQKSPMDELGDQVKALEAAFGQRVAWPGTFLMVRADGRAFHTFTKDLDRPFDPRMSEAMLYTTQQLCHEFNARLGYTQSDEITLAFYYDSSSQDYPFSGRLQKMCSLIAATATALFTEKVYELMPHKAKERPVFDSRVFKAVTLDTAIQSFVWREKDAMKNSVSMAASAHYTPKELHGLHTKDRLRLLEEKGVIFNDYPLHLRKGVYFHRQPRMVKLDQATLDKIPPGKAPPDGMVIRRSVELAKFETLLGLTEDEQRAIFGMDEDNEPT